MRKSLLIAGLVAMLAGQSLMAADLIVAKSGTEVKKITNVKVIKFNDSSITVTGDTEETVANDDFDSFKFAVSATSGIAEVATTSNIGYSNNTLILPADAISVSIYNLAGVSVMKTAASTEVSIADLAAGVYIVDVKTKAGRSVLKIVKK